MIHAEEDEVVKSTSDSRTRALGGELCADVSAANSTVPGHSQGKMFVEKDEEMAFNMSCVSYTIIRAPAHRTSHPRPVWRYLF